MIDIYSLNAGQLNELGINMEDGLTQYSVPLKISLITPPQIASELAAFLGLDGVYNSARSARQTASDAVQGATGALFEWLGVVKGVLTSSFGQRWSSQWVQVGFVTPSLAIPRKSSEQYALATRMIAFFTKLPTYQVPEVKATAAQGTLLQSAITGAKKTLKDQKAALTGIGTAWDSAYNLLTGTMWSLVKILQGSLAANDPRWLAFGLPMPSTPSTPGQPVNVAAQASDTGAIILTCDVVPLATRYRWRMLLAGVQQEYQLMSSTTEPMGSIPGILPGQTAQIIVQAVNGGLQGVPSEPVLFSMPLAKAAGAKRAAVEAPAAVEAAKANGNGNGLTNGAHARH